MSALISILMSQVSILLNSKYSEKRLFCNKLACFLIRQILTCVMNALAYHYKITILFRFYRIGSIFKIWNKFFFATSSKSKRSAFLLKIFWLAVEYFNFIQFFVDMSQVKHFRDWVRAFTVQARNLFLCTTSHSLSLCFKLEFTKKMWKLESVKLELRYFIYC